MKLLLRAGHALLCTAVVGVVSAACYTAGNGTAPPMSSFYFPTGLAVSKGGNVLYAINSDFDLQWNGGTLQSYDLLKIRHDAAALIKANMTGATLLPKAIPLVPGATWQPNCLSMPPASQGNSFGVQLSQGCAPQVDSTRYVQDSAIVGAFATDLQVSNDGARLLSPVAGNATVTWADIPVDPGTPAPSENLDDPPGPVSSFAPFWFNCGIRSDSRCAGDHSVGNDSNSPGNTRNLTMPGSPFGMAQSQDGSVIAVTSETSNETSLLTTGLPPFEHKAEGYPTGWPTMQFVLSGVPNGGVGLASVPHDPNTWPPPCELVGDASNCTRQTFLETSRQTSEVDLLTYYDDNGSTLLRPFLTRSRAYSVDTNLGGSDFRGIAIDPTPRYACEASGSASPQTCGQIPARVFIASRTPPTLVVGQVGLVDEVTGTYDPDAFRTTGNIPLPQGPSNVYLAPVVVLDSPGATTEHYELRVFVVLFDSATIAVIDPDLPPPLRQVEYIAVGAGPYSMAFDPFDLHDVAAHKAVPVDTRQPDTSLGLKKYRFGYVGSFTQSYVQVVDLDQQGSPAEASVPGSYAGITYEKVVYTLGAPSYPKGQAP